MHNDRPAPQTSPTGFRRTLKRALAAVTAGLLSATLIAAAPPAAQADTKPISADLPATVSADPLPTWQLAGVVWSQVVVGTTVYATGDFTKARPPGTKEGSSSEIDAPYIFAYDIRTGNPVSSFSHQLGAPGQAIAASPDGKRIYVGGDFTTVDNQVRSHVAAFDTASGALVSSFAPAINGQVKAIAATNTQVFVGGSFDTIGKESRKRLASITTAGQLTSWAPRADDGRVWALVVTPDKSKVVVGGQFSTLNKVVVNGMGAVSATTGTTAKWAASSILKNYNNGATDSLTTDGKYIYGSGFAFGDGGQFEGAFALNPTGSVRWIADCQGDTYDVEPVGSVVYTASHAHNCTMIGGFPDTKPRTRWQRANALTSAPMGVNSGPDMYGWNYKGQPAPKILQWYPKFDIGTASGQGQATWSVVHGSGYVAYGGEFPRVNGRAQQGLVRFALAATADNKVGPTYLDTLPPRSEAPPTVAKVVGPGSVRVTFGSAWDMDNQRLTYQLYRDPGTDAEKLIRSVTYDSNFWTVPNRIVTDVRVPAGTHTYQVRVNDPFDNEVLSPVSEPVTVDEASAFATQVAADGANHFWRLGESSGPAYDSINITDGSFGAGVQRATPGAHPNDPDRAITLPGTAAGAVSLGGKSAKAPTTFSVLGWFNTKSTAGGEIVKFGTARTGVSKLSDRHVYLGKNRRLVFGVRDSSKKNRVITSAKTYNDGKWHMFVATFGSGGMVLYVDGNRVARNTSVKKAVSYSGYWRIGGDTVSGWSNKPPAKGLSASVDDVATFPFALSATKVKDEFSQASR